MKNKIKLIIPVFLIVLVNFLVVTYRQEKKIYSFGIPLKFEIETSTLPKQQKIQTKTKEHLYSNKSILEKKRHQIAIIIVADQNSQIKYNDNIQNIKCYADYYDYKFIVTDTNPSCKGHFFFKKHCTVRNLMNKQEFKWALVLDGDVAVVNFQRQLTEFVSNDNVSVIHGIRFHNNEVSAGLYFVQNNEYGRTYLDEWVNAGYKGFNYDNGALHYFLLDKLANGIPGSEGCRQKGQKSNDLYSYDLFLKCFHEILSKSICNKEIKILRNDEENPEWIAIDSDRPKGTWTSSSFLHHAMKPPHQLRKAPQCQKSLFEGKKDEWYVSEDKYKKNLKDFWLKSKRRNTGFGFDLCKG